MEEVDTTWGTVSGLIQSDDHWYEYDDDRIEALGEGICGKFVYDTLSKANLPNDHVSDAFEAIFNAHKSEM